MACGLGVLSGYYIFQPIIQSSVQQQHQQWVFIENGILIAQLTLPYRGSSSISVETARSSEALEKEQVKQPQ